MGGGEYLGRWGHQQDWDRSWVEVTNEVYQAELVRRVGDREECEQIALEMDKCKVGNYEAKVVVNVENKVVSGLGEML